MRWGRLQQAERTPAMALGSPQANTESSQVTSLDPSRDPLWNLDSLDLKSWMANIVDLSVNTYTPHNHTILHEPHKFI